jgi:hypothetical protein
MSNQLEFSLKLTTDHVPFEQDIFFVVTFTNTTDQPIILREPRQLGVIEALYPDTTLLFVVEPISVSVPFQYPLADRSVDLLRPPVKRDEFITLPPHGVHETRLKLPRLVFRNASIEDVISLPVGQYLIRMTYDNRFIGYEVERSEGIRYVDVGAWVGSVEANPVLLTITP